MTAAQMFTQLSSERVDGTVIIPCRNIVGIHHRTTEAWGSQIPFEIEYVGLSNVQRWKLQAKRMNELLPGIVSDGHAAEALSSLWSLGKFRKVTPGRSA